MKTTAFRSSRVLVDGEAGCRSTYSGIRKIVNVILGLEGKAYFATFRVRIDGAGLESIYIYTQVPIGSSSPPRARFRYFS